MHRYIPLVLSHYAMTHNCNSVGVDLLQWLLFLIRSSHTLSPFISFYCFFFYWSSGSDSTTLAAANFILWLPSSNTAGLHVPIAHSVSPGARAERVILQLGRKEINSEKVSSTPDVKERSVDVLISQPTEPSLLCLRLPPRAIKGDLAWQNELVQAHAGDTIQDFPFLNVFLYELYRPIGKFGSLPRGKFSYDRVVLLNLRRMLSVLVFP